MPKKKYILSKKNKGLMTSLLLWGRFELKKFKKIKCCWVTKNKKKQKNILKIVSKVP